MGIEGLYTANLKSNKIKLCIIHVFEFFRPLFPSCTWIIKGSCACGQGGNNRKPVSVDTIVSKSLPQHLLWIIFSLWKLRPSDHEALLQSTAREPGLLWSRTPAVWGRSRCVQTLSHCLPSASICCLSLPGLPWAWTPAKPYSLCFPLTFLRSSHLQGPLMRNTWEWHMKGNLIRDNQ